MCKKVHTFVVAKLTVCHFDTHALALLVTQALCLNDDAKLRHDSYICKKNVIFFAKYVRKMCDLESFQIRVALNFL